MPSLATIPRRSRGKRPDWPRERHRSNRHPATRARAAAIEWMNPALIFAAQRGKVPACRFCPVTPESPVLPAGPSRIPARRGCMGSGCSATESMAPTFRCRFGRVSLRRRCVDCWRLGLPAPTSRFPHKIAAFEVCDTIDETAQRAGAVNTLVFRGRQDRRQQHRRLWLRGQSPRAWGEPRGGTGAAARRRRLGACGGRGAARCGRAGDRGQPHPRSCRGSGARPAGAAHRRMGRQSGSSRRPCAWW